MAVSIYDTVLASQTLIEQLRSKGYSEYLIAMSLANAEIERAILKTNGVWTKRKLNALKKLIETELLKAYGGLFESIQDESVEIAKVNFEAIATTAGITASLPKSAVQDLVNSKRPIQMGFNDKTKEVRTYEFEELFKGTQVQNANILKTILAGSVASGKTPQQIARDVTFKSNQLSKGQMRRNIFTVMVDSKNQAVYDSYEQIEKTGLDIYYEHDSVLDSLTSPVCRSLDQRKYYVPIEEIPPALRPPLHNSCRSQLTMRVKDFSDTKGLRASAFGPVENISYPQWFKDQSSAFQKSVLGPKKYSLYKEGKYQIKSFPDVVDAKTINMDSYRTKLKKYTEET